MRIISRSPLDIAGLHHRKMQHVGAQSQSSMHAVTHREAAALYTGMPNEVKDIDDSPR